MELLQNGVGAVFPEELLACLILQNFGMFELGKITFRLGQSKNEFKTTVCKSNKKADILTTGLKIKDIL